MNRRTFTRLGTFAILFASTGLSMLLSGCNVFSDIKAWLPIGEAALSSILLVLSSNGIILPAQVQTVVGLIKARFDALTAAIAEYQSTTPAPVGALAKIETAFKDIVDNFSTFLQSLSVSSGLLGIIVGLAQIVLSTIAAFVNRLPASVNVKAVRSRLNATMVGGRALVIVPKQRNTGQFRTDYNGVLKTAPPDVDIPAAAYLK